jgi:hypothetical protein
MTAQSVNFKVDRLTFENYQRLKFLNDRTINMRTIIVDGIIAGSIAKFEMEGEAEITYWIDKKTSE